MYEKQKDWQLWPVQDRVYHRRAVQNKRQQNGREILAGVIVKDKVPTWAHAVEKSSICDMSPGPGPLS